MPDVLVINPEALPLSPGVNDADSFVQLIGTKLYRCPATLAKAYFESAGGGGTTLATPTLSLTVISSSQINLSWTNVANESSYELQRSPNGSTGWTTINSPAANTTSFNNTGLTASTTYYYRIRAVGDGVTYLNSPYSSIQSGTTSAAGLTPLSTPTLTATVISSTQIDLSWTNVANESSYMLEWSPNGTSGWTQIGGTIAANTTAYSHTGLTPLTAYFYRIKAVGDGVTYSDSGYGTDNDTTSAGGTAYLTWGTLATKHEQYNSNQGIRKKTGEGNSWDTGANNVSVSTQTIGVGERVVFKVAQANVDTLMVALAAGATPVDVFGATGSPFGIVSAPFIVAYGKEEGANAPGTPSESLSDGNFLSIFYENSTTVKYQKSTNGTTWTTWYTSTNTPSGSYYVHVQINAELTGAIEIYKA
jgi:hypothetical protein